MSERKTSHPLRVLLHLGVVCTVLGSLVAASGCATLKEAGIAYPSASVQGVEMGPIGLTALTLDFAIDVNNPYSVALPMSGLDFALSSDGTQFLSGKVDTPYTIPAGEVQSLQIPIQVPYKEMYDLIRGVEGGKTIPYRADFGLNVQAPVVGSITLPLDAEGELNVPRL